MADALTEDLRGLGLEVEEDDSAGNRLRLRQPARAHPGARGRADRPALRAHGHRAARRAGRGGERQRPPHEPPRGDPRRRQQGGGRDDPGRRAPARARTGKPPAGVELLFTTGEEQALKGAKAVDMSRLQRRLRLRLRPRLADRRDRDRVADLLLGGGALPRPGRARRHPARGGPQRDRGRGAGDRGDADRPARRRDDRERRPHRGRHGGERGGRALLRGARDAQPRRRARGARS